jgi:NAD(P)-dependent dehydrogenase (short-subunit alcohol dehydrogenase family)
MGVELDGAVVVVTGAAGGIGTALAVGFARAGADVVGADLPGRGADVDLDVRDADATRRVLSEVRATRGRLDVVVANAGIGVGGLTEDLSIDDWHRSIDVNVRGTANTVHAAYPLLVEQRRGALVLMSSLAGLAGLPLLVPYATTKFAVVGLAQSLRPEAARHGVGVTAVCPGPVETPLLEEVARTDGLSVRRYLTATGGKPMAPERLADAVVRAVRENRALVAPGRAGLLWRLNRMLPNAVAKVIARGMRDELAAARREVDPGAAS